jgi:50S ribosomal subunit-associated GTPase HflX
MLRDRELLRVREVIYASKVDLTSKAAWMNSFNAQQADAQGSSAEQQAGLDAMMRQVREQLRLKEVIFRLRCSVKVELAARLTHVRDSQ